MGSRKKFQKIMKKYSLSLWAVHKGLIRSHILKTRDRNVVRINLNDALCQ